MLAPGAVAIQRWHAKGLKIKSDSNSKKKKKKIEDDL